MVYRPALCCYPVHWQLAQFRKTSFSDEPLDALTVCIKRYTNMMSGRIDSFYAVAGDIFIDGSCPFPVCFGGFAVKKPFTVTFAFGKRQVTVSVHSFDYTWIRSLDRN